MGAVQGFKGAAGIAKESVYGTHVDPTMFLPVTRLSVNGRWEYTESKGIRHRRGDPPPTPTAFRIDGSFEWECDPDNVGLILKLGIGADSVTQFGAVAAYLHQFKFGEDIESFTLDVNQNIIVRQVAGCRVKSLEFQLSPKQYLMGTCNFAAKTEAATTETSPTFSTKKIFHYSQIGAAGVQINGSACTYVEQFTITINNNTDDDYATTASGVEVQEIVLEKSNITGSMTLGFESFEQYELFWGGAGVTAPQTNPDPVSISFLLTSPEEIGSTGYYHSIKFVLGAAYYESCDTPLDGPGRIKQTITFRGAEVVAAGMDDLVVELTNSDGAAY